MAKSDLYVFGGYVLLGLALAINPLTIPLFQSLGYLPPVPEHHLYANDIQYLLPALAAILFGSTGAIMVFMKRRLRYYLNDSFLYNLFMFSLLLGIMFSLNVVHPGRLNGLRMGYILLLMFFATNTLYQAVVKKRDGSETHPFYRNLAVSAYGIVMLLLIFEGIFMWHQGTHRFNGTLASRAWFMHHWQLNAEGYRDAEYDSASVSGKRKVLVMGDSFVAGHGVANPKDRFSDLIAAKLPQDAYRVFNLGVGGSDTRDENERLREFPYRPDMLVMSWYPNDIEQDGERGGLILQHARSYHDIWGPARYFARRSYLWNYLYWQFPHPDELSDYFGYIKQCFSYLKVRNMHLREIDRMVAYGDSLGIPMVAVVFPFLENAEGSRFATDVIEQRFAMRGVPVVSVRNMIKDKPASEFIVNRNDPHPNEHLHAMVADAVMDVLNGKGQVTDQPLMTVPADLQEPSAPSVEPDTAHQHEPPAPKVAPKNSKPSSGTKPSTKPGSTTKPGSSTKPSSDSKSGTNTKPGSSTKPSSDSKSGTTTKPESSTKPSSDSKSGTTTKPGSSTKPSSNSKSGSTAKPDAKTASPDSKSGSTTKPTSGSTKPTTKPGSGTKPTTKPDNGTTNPDSKTTNPDAKPGSNSKAANGGTKPTTKPDNGSTKPTDGTSKPTTQPASGNTKPTNGSTKPDSKPTADNAKPANGATKPSNGSSKPDPKPTTDGQKPDTKPASDSQKPETKPSTTKPAKPKENGVPNNWMGPHKVDI